VISLSCVNKPYAHECILVLFFPSSRSQCETVGRSQSLSAKGELGSESNIPRCAQRLRHDARYMTHRTWILCVAFVLHMRQIHETFAQHSRHICTTFTKDLRTIIETFTWEPRTWRASHPRILYASVACTAARNEGCCLWTPLWS
jgi:hypothetical protein